MRDSPIEASASSSPRRSPLTELCSSSSNLLVEETYAEVRTGMSAGAVVANLACTVTSLDPETATPLGRVSSWRVTL